MILDDSRLLDVPRIVLNAWRTASEIASYITILYYNILEYCGEFRVTESRCQCSAMETVPTRYRRTEAVALRDGQNAVLGEVLDQVRRCDVSDVNER